MEVQRTGRNDVLEATKRAIARGVSQAALARAIGCSTQNFSNYVRTGNLGGDFLLKLYRELQQRGYMDALKAENQSLWDQLATELTPVVSAFRSTVLSDEDKIDRLASAHKQIREALRKAGVIGKDA